MKRCREVGAELQTGCWGWKLEWRGAGKLVLSCRQVAEFEYWSEEVQGVWCWAADRLLRMKTRVMRAGGRCWAADRLLRMKTRMKRCREVGAELQTGCWGWKMAWRAGGLVTGEYERCGYSFILIINSSRFPYVKKQFRPRAVSPLSSITLSLPLCRCLEIPCTVHTCRRLISPNTNFKGICRESLAR